MNELPKLSVTKTFSLTMEHIAKVADMSQRTGKSQGAVVRDAIDLLYERLDTAPSSAKKQAQTA